MSLALPIKFNTAYLTQGGSLVKTAAVLRSELLDNQYKEISVTMLESRGDTQPIGGVYQVQVDTGKYLPHKEDSWDLVEEVVGSIKSPQKKVSKRYTSREYDRVVKELEEEREKSDAFCLELAVIQEQHISLQQVVDDLNKIVTTSREVSNRQQRVIEGLIKDKEELQEAEGRLRQTVLGTRESIENMKEDLVQMTELHEKQCRDLLRANHHIDMLMRRESHESVLL